MTRRSKREDRPDRQPRQAAPPRPVDESFPEVEFDNRIGFLDVVDLAFTRATLSPGAQLFAGFFMALGLLAVLGGTPPGVWVPLLIVGLFVGTGIIFLPFSWFTYLAVPELMNEKVEADPSGMRIHVLERIVVHPWTVYKFAIETPRLFILRSRVVPSQIFATRGLSAPQVGAFRAILQEVGLLTETADQQRRKAWIGFIVGAVVAVLLPFLFAILSFLAPA